MNKLSLLLLPLCLTSLLVFGCHAPTAPAAKGELSLPAGSTGDPPAIPHAVDDAAGGASCLTCHRDGSGGAPKTPHPQLIDCRQCHIVPGEKLPPFKPSY